MKKHLAVILMLASSISAHAAGYESQVLRSDKPHQYMVSAMLKKNTEEGTVRLVQSIETAHSKEEASGKFLQHIRTEFSGYAILDSLVQPVAELSNCENWI